MESNPKSLLGLLQLPQEIQDHIYSYVIGYATICLQTSRCSNQVPFNVGGPDLGPIVRHEDGCRLCATARPWGFSLRHIATSGEFPSSDQAVSTETQGSRDELPVARCGHQPESRRKLSIAFLWTCRQVYRSAMPLLYRNYTFCLGPGSSTEIPKSFCTSLTPLQSASLRTINLHVVLARRHKSNKSHHDHQLDAANSSSDAAFFDETIVIGDWKEVVEASNEASSFQGLAGLPGLRTLAIDFRWQKRLQMWHPFVMKFPYTMLPLLAAFEGVARLRLAELRVQFWRFKRERWRGSRRQPRGWERVPSLEKRIRARLFRIETG